MSKSIICPLCFDHLTIGLMISCSETWNVQFWTTPRYLCLSMYRGCGLVIDTKQYIFPFRCTCKQDNLLNLRLFTKYVHCCIFEYWIESLVRIVLGFFSVFLSFFFRTAYYYQMTSYLAHYLNVFLRLLSLHFVYQTFVKTWQTL